MALEREFPGSKVAAFSVCPDFKATRMGVYTTNHWTCWADQRLLDGPTVNTDMDRGLLKENYQEFLYWAYSRFLEKMDNKKDIFVQRTKDLMDVANGSFFAPWLMSFDQKGFLFNTDRDTLRSGIVLTKFDLGGLLVERELLDNSFGEPSIVERYYYQNFPNRLDEVVTISPDPTGRIVMRIDDPECWGYQQSWYTSFLVGDTLLEKMADFNNMDAPLPKVLSKKRFLTQYSGSPW